jgi:hypothetical protein
VRREMAPKRFIPDKEEEVGFSNDAENIGTTLVLVLAFAFQSNIF